MFCVAYGLSPVIIFVVTPYSFNFCIVSFTSFLGGSKNATNPTNTILDSSDISNIFFPLYSLFDDNAITCIPCCAISLAFSWIFSFISSVISSILLSTLTLVQILRISSRAPFVIIL